MKFNLKKFALLVEIIGGISIIISLIFVGIQLRENSKATRSATAAATVSELTSFYSNLGNSEQGSRVFYEFMVRPDSLSETERFQAIMNAHGVMLTIQNSYYLVKEGTLDEEIMNSVMGSVLATKDNPGFKVFWNARRDLFFEEFQAYIDSLRRDDSKISREIYE